MTTFDSISIRRASTADAPTLRRLAALDSKRLPAGDHLIADVEGKAWAAVSIETGEVVADPFVPSGHAAELLRLRAERLSDGDRSRRPLVRRLAALRAA